MAILPIILNGDTLGQRHRNLNALVDQAYNSDVNFLEIKSIPEQSPIDRLFKIDLASKLRDVDYIIENIKDDDMLYVSRALKCKWLLENEYQNVISPEYLEQDLYPNMITTAVNKMKWWISVHLKNPERCQEFYNYYYNKNFKLAIRFLVHSPESYMLNEIPKILDRLNPFYFKVFCETNPLVAKIFYDSLMTNEKVLIKYLDKEREFYESLKVVLKSDGNIYLDITEKYFNNDSFTTLSAIATEYIISHFKERFISKPELYAAWLLDIKTLAECLTVEECKDLVLKLARAEYLSQWFNYKNIEPLIKRLPTEERAIFKKKVFVTKDIGEKVTEWPYKIPSRPIKEDDTKIFEDIIHSPQEYEVRRCLRRKVKKKKGPKCENIVFESERTLLDELFDEFRFMSFEKTLFELRKRILIESSPQTRQYIMLVLVSKTGGRAESIAALLQLLSQHQNEPPHVRATIIRSLVKRAFVWRIPQDSWQSMMTFAVGLGLDGKTPEADCREGLHAVILRNLLGSGCVEPGIFSAFLEKFSTLKEYSLTAPEKKAVTERLPALLLASIVNENGPEKQASLFNLLFHTLDDYKLPIDTCPVVPALAALANRNLDAARSLLLRLFYSKKARRDLFEQNFACVSTDASYLNALRHNTDILKKEEYVKRALNVNTKKKMFFRKLAIYFTEDNGLADLYLSSLKCMLSTEHNAKFSRPFTILIRSNLEPYLEQIKENEDKLVRRFATALKANVHLARPKLNIEVIGYKTIGPVAVANVASICRHVEIDKYLATLIKWPRTLRLTLMLSERLNIESKTFETIASIRPNLALKSALKYFRRNPESANLKPIWKVDKPILANYKFGLKPRSFLAMRVWKVDEIPKDIKADYCTILYVSAKKDYNLKEAPMLCNIENLLPKVDHGFIENILSDFLQNGIIKKSDLENEFTKVRETCLYLRILVKFLLLSKSEEIQKEKIEKYAEPLLNILSNSDFRLPEYIEEVLITLRYNAVFFNQEYVSCMPVFERFVSWMHSIFPLDTCFKYYGEIHLTMLFFRSVRQCLKHKPDMFIGDKGKFKRGVEILGTTFGTYIAKEVDELKSNYFESIIELYKDLLNSYLSVYFVGDPLKENFIINIIKGIVDYGDRTTPLLGVYLFENIYYSKDSDTAKEIKVNLYKKDSKEMTFFLESKAFI